MGASPGGRIIGGNRNHFWIAACVTLALDQLTKHAIALSGGGQDPITLIPMFLRLVRQNSNPRGAFSLGPQGAGFYVLATVVGLALIGWFFVAVRDGRLPFYIGLGLLAGGALGNLIDRLVLGAVRDFIDLHWMGKAHWPAFNVADAAICAGVALLLWETFGHPGRRPAEAPTGRAGGSR